MASLELSDEENEIGAGRNNEGGYRSDEAVEDGAEINGEEEWDGEGRRIDPATSKKRVARNPQPKLNIERLQGPKGIQTIEKYFEGFKFHGKGHEKSDLDKIMKRLEHWAHRLFPKYQFDDFLEKMEILGRKKNVQVYLKKYRLGMETPVVDIEDADEETGTERREQQPAPEGAPVDEFDKLIAEQIEKQKQVAREHEKQANTSISEPSGNVLGTAKPLGMSEEMKARIEANRQLALERKNARLRRIEEENKKQKLQESQVDSQVSETHETPPTVSALEKLDKDVVVEKIQSTVVDLSAMEVSNEQPAERAAIIEEPIVDVTSDSDRGQGQHSIDLTIESLPDNYSTEEPMKANKTPNRKAFSMAEIIAIQDGRYNVNESTTTNGTFYGNSTHHGEESENMQDEMECSNNVSKTYGSANKKPNDDPDKLLTKEELQMEIDNAIEEIISRNAHRNK